MNKKTLLFALPAVVGAAGLFSVPGAYATNKCDYEKDDTQLNPADVVDCETITLKNENPIEIIGGGVLTLSHDNVTIVGKTTTGDGETKGNALKGRIVIQNANSVTLDNISLYSDDGSNPLIDVQSSNTSLTVRESNILLDANGKVDTASVTKGKGIAVAEGKNGSTITIDNSRIKAQYPINIKSGNNTININNNSKISGHSVRFEQAGASISGNTLNVTGGSTITGYADSTNEGGVISVYSHDVTINVSGDSTIANSVEAGNKDENLFFFEDYATGSVIVNGATLTLDEDGKGSYIFDDAETDGGTGGNADFAAYDTKITASDDHIVSSDKYVVTFETGYYNGRVNMVGVNTHSRINGSLIPAPKTVNNDLAFNGKWYTDISRAADTEFDFASTDIDGDLTVYAGYTIGATTNPGDQGNSQQPGDNQQNPGDNNQNAGNQNAGGQNTNPGDVNPNVTPSTSDDNVENPYTADEGIALYTVIATVALLGLGATALAGKKVSR